MTRRIRNIAVCLTALVALITTWFVLSGELAARADKLPLREEWGKLATSEREDLDEKYSAAPSLYSSAPHYVAWSLWKEEHQNPEGCDFGGTIAVVLLSATVIGALSQVPVKRRVAVPKKRTVSNTSTPANKPAENERPVLQPLPRGTVTPPYPSAN